MRRACGAVTARMLRVAAGGQGHWAAEHGAGTQARHRRGHAAAATRAIMILVGGRHGNLKRKERTCGGSQCRPHWQAGSELVRAAAVTVPTGTDRPGRARAAAGALPLSARTAARAIPGGGWTSRRATSEAGRSGQVRFITRPKLV